MNRKNSIYLQLAIWLSLYIVYLFSSESNDKFDTPEISATIRIILNVVFFNVFYYYVMPFYFNGQRKMFNILLPLIFLGFILINIGIDFALHMNVKTFVHDGKMVTKHKPWQFIVLPPFFIGLSLFGCAASIKGINEYEKKKLEQEEAHSKKVEAELQLLKSQINPHFLSNTLNNIYGLSLTNSPMTSDAILRLSGMVNFILHECHKEKVLLQDDITFIKDYIELQMMRMPKNMHIKVDLPQNIDGRLMIEPMVLITFIENAFKHGVTAIAEATIEIEIKLFEKLLILHVCNPIFEKASSNLNPTGIGITNTKQRLEQVYGENYTLKFRKDNGMHDVTLEIKLV